MGRGLDQVRRTGRADPGWRPAADAEIAGSVEDGVTARAITAWNGTGSLVEEPWRARWFVLDGTTLTTLSGPSYTDDPLATSYDTRTYASDIAAYRDASQDMPGLWIGRFYLGPTRLVITIAVTVVALLAGLAMAVVMRRQRAT